MRLVAVVEVHLSKSDAPMYGHPRVLRGERRQVEHMLLAARAILRIDDLRQNPSASTHSSHARMSP